MAFVGDQLIGQVGHVTMRIAGAGRPGEVQLPIRGGSESFIAYGDEPIEAGAAVLVVGARPGRVVEVARLSG
ncbi:hypothetical protein GHK86_02655 [Acidimicrobiaceae bacterium USS-CC1]|uniref:RCK C-terminal domain-containing protein n=1 Tax=Acidiferrimicrobium australe TaxID=2664430 RepID=A0ABW9QQL0_9ACTN|nr:hypothetical protein [Acidiferrimicrobium australe]